MKTKLKVCGMKNPDNIKEVAALQPNYLGFIFYPKSKRNFDGVIPKISDKIKKTGVFVNSSYENILEKVNKYELKALQLHGEESVSFCKVLRTKLKDANIEIIKAFSVDEHFDFTVIEKYELICDYFLFDTKGKEKGGNGITFNWKLLEKYTSQKPYFLSGGVGLDSVNEIKTFLKTNASKKCFAIDVNSKFEIKPGIKNTDKLKEFKEFLKN